MRVYKGFSKEDGTLIDTAYFDGYAFGDRILEGVMFKATVKDGKMLVEYAEPDDPYLDGLNKREWLTAALKHASDGDVFDSSLNDESEQVVLEFDE